MSPIEFAKKLLSLWGCRLIQVFVDDDGNEEGILQRADVVNNNTNNHSSNNSSRQTAKMTTAAKGKGSSQQNTNTNTVIFGSIQQQQHQQQHHLHQLQQLYRPIPLPLPPVLEGHQLQQLQAFPLPHVSPLPLPPQPLVAVQRRFSATSEASGNTSDNTSTAAFTLSAFGGNPSGNPFGIGMGDGNAAVAAATTAATNTLTGIGGGNINGNANAFINNNYNTSYDNTLVVGTTNYDQHQTPMKRISTSLSPHNSASSGGGSGKKNLKRPPKKFFGDTTDLAVAQNMRLSHPDDSEHLNSLHCFVRTELLEVFALKPGAVNDSNDQHNIVGIRCTQCGTLSKKERGGEKMAVFFPKSVQDLYRGVW